MTSHLFVIIKEAARKRDMMRAEYAKLQPQKLTLKHFSDDYVFQPKINGVPVVISFEKGGPRVYTAIGKRGQGGQEQTGKFPRLSHGPIPETLQGTVIRAEAWVRSPKTGRSGGTREVSRILRTGDEKVRTSEFENGALRTTAYDVIKHKGKSVKQLPYSEKIEILQQISQQIPAIEVVDSAYDMIAKDKLLRNIEEGAIEEGHTGVVVRPLREGGDKLIWSRIEKLPPEPKAKKKKPMKKQAVTNESMATILRKIRRKGIKAEYGEEGEKAHHRDIHITTTKKDADRVSRVLNRMGYPMEKKFKNNNRIHDIATDKEPGVIAVKVGSYLHDLITRR